LEAYAQLKLTEIGTGDTVACVQATLSNGLSTHQHAVEWATGGLAFFALASAMWQWAIPDSLAPVRLLDLVALYQTIASSGLLTLNYPSVYRNFALNFAWSLGLFPSSSIQHSINNMRALTGGDNKNGTSNAVGLVNRRLSPYNSVDALRAYVAPQALIARIKALPRLAFSSDGASESTASPAINVMQLASAGEVQTYSPSSDEVLDAGLPIYTNSLDIATANAFMTVFFTVLILSAIVLGTLGLIYVFTSVLAQRYPASRHYQHFKETFPAFCQAWGLRVVRVLAYLVLVLFAYPVVRP
jgi:hypothetical protein